MYLYGVGGGDDVFRGGLAQNVWSVQHIVHCSILQCEMWHQPYSSLHPRIRARKTHSTELHCTTLHSNQYYSLFAPKNCITNFVQHIIALYRNQRSAVQCRGLICWDIYSGTIELRVTCRVVKNVHWARDGHVLLKPLNIHFFFIFANRNNALKVSHLSAKVLDIRTQLKSKFKLWKHWNLTLLCFGYIWETFSLIFQTNSRKIPHTGDTNSLDRCG